MCLQVKLHPIDTQGASGRSTGIAAAVKQKIVSCSNGLHRIESLFSNNICGHSTPKFKGQLLNVDSEIVISFLV